MMAKFTCSALMHTPQMIGKPNFNFANEYGCLPKFSILMSVYKNDKPKHFSQCLESLAGQTYLATEVVIVEDGLIGKELKDIVEIYRHKLNIITVIQEQNQGLAVSLNNGMEHCSHELIARMDADDICLPSRFEKQLALFQNDQDYDVVGSFATEISEDGVYGALRSMPITHDAILNNLWTSPFIHSTVLYRRNKILAVGGYKNTLRRRQDYELWFRCAKAGLKFANFPEPLVLYRFDVNSLKKQSIKLALQQALIGFRGANMIGMPTWKCLACFIPFLRSLLPSKIQYSVYIYMRSVDPRQRVKRG